MKITNFALLCLLVMVVPVDVEAQYTLVYETNYPEPGIYVTGYTGTPVNLIIPDFVNGIGTIAFSHCLSLTNVVAGTNLTNLENDAFNQCTNLISVVISNAGANFTEGVFNDCFSLQSVIIGGGLSGTNGVLGVGPFAGIFLGCASLTNVFLGNGITIIGASAFNACHKLSQVVIPKGVVDISENAFSDSGLTSINIPSTVTSLGDGAFGACYNLTNVFFAGNPPYFGSAVFSGNSLTLYYLPGTMGWTSNFDNLPTLLWNPSIQTNGGSFGISNNQFGFNITALTNLPIAVETCTNLASPVWVPLTNLTVTNGSVYFSDPQSTNYPQRFYGLGFP